MIRPESDWSLEDPRAVGNFTIDRSFAMRDVTTDIRRFSWLTRRSGFLRPEKHYLDFSLAHRPRHSVLNADTWDEPHCSGEIVYLPPRYTYFGKPALQERHLLTLGFGDSYLETLFEGELPVADLMPSPDVQSPSLKRMLFGLASELTAPGFASETLLESMIVAIVVELVRHVRRAEPERPGAGPVDRQVRRIGDFVMGNLASQLSVADIARECGMSTRHVSRVFKDATGTSLGEFVARARVALAKDLLASASEPVKEISWRCGFGSTSAFSAAFRGATGMTPREYRQLSRTLQ